MESASKFRAAAAALDSETPEQRRRRIEKLRPHPGEGHPRDTESDTAMNWLVWFAYYSETATVGIVEAEAADEACQRFWNAHGDGSLRPSGVHAIPATPGRFIEIHAEH